MSPLAKVLEFDCSTSFSFSHHCAYLCFLWKCQKSYKSEFISQATGYIYNFDYLLGFQQRKNEYRHKKRHFLKVGLIAATLILIEEK